MESNIYIFFVIVFTVIRESAIRNTQSIRVPDIWIYYTSLWLSMKNLA